MNRLTASQKMKYAFPVVALILSVALCAGGVFAWLAYNRDLTSGGMEMTATTSPNLVISATNTDTVGGIAYSNILNTEFPFRVNLSAQNYVGTMEPCTHVSSAPLGLQYSSYPEGIDYATGIGAPGLVDVPVNTPGYYCDYVVYIASAGAALTNVNLQASVSLTGATPVTDDTSQALTVDFYVDGDYKDTVNVAGKQYNDVTKNKTVVDLFNGSVPANTTGSLKITMRVYFDGALLKPDNTAYITSQTLNVGTIGFQVDFTANDNNAQ